MDEGLREELTRLQQSWLEHLYAWERSGTSLKAYAERHGLDPRRLYRFKRRLTDKGVYQAGEALRRRFVQAHVGPLADSAPMWRVRFNNGCVVELVGGSSPASLRELLHTVGTLP